MNAHTPLPQAAQIDLEAASQALGRIGHLADGLVLIGDKILQEGDALQGNVVATLAGLVRDLADRGGEALTVR